MSIDPLSDQKIIDSWHKNAAPWIVAIRERQIASRTLVTDAAIIEAVVSRRGQKVLDLGCGEGWLSRELIAQGMDVFGVDVVPELIDRARTIDLARFAVVSYEEIAAGKLAEKFDVVVANFSLLGDRSVWGLFSSISTLLAPHGSFIVQTIHPAIACGEYPYIDGWRAGSWTGFSADFSDPAPWYFRTLATWVQLYVESGLQLTEIREPLHPQSGKPASIVLIGISGGFDAVRPDELIS
jgi:2-polyprenyl-3-methyl-5-hydroxy-6-metoxy-1,4-benzoquinol methylase